MSGLAELKKQERTLKARPRTNVPSYEIEKNNKLTKESTNSIQEEPVKINTEEKIPAEEIHNASKNNIEPDQKQTIEIAKADIITEKTKIETKLEEKAEEMVVPKEKNQSQIKTSSYNKEEVVKSVTVRLIDIDDADYLKYACKERGMNMQEFFWSIMDNDIKNNYTINPKDEDHMTFKNITLPEIRTIPIPKSLKEKIAKNAGKHRLPETRYMALTIHQARMNDENWN